MHAHTHARAHTHTHTHTHRASRDDTPHPARPSLPQPEWRPFDAEAYNQPWSVPWGPGAVAGTMAAWVVTFVGTAFLAAPALYVGVTRTPLWELGPSGQADFALWSELLEAAVTAGLLWFVTSK